MKGKREREEIALFMNEKKEEEEIRIRGSRREMQNEREREISFLSRVRSRPPR